MGILSQESLLRLMSIANGLKDAKDVKDVLHLKSSLNDDLYYEIQKIKTDLFIFVCSSRKGPEEERLFCCYINGDIIYDGFWLYELEESLPLLYNRLVKVYHKIKIANNQLDIKLEYIDLVEINELNNQFLRSGLIDKQLLQKHFKSTRFRY